MSIARDIAAWLSSSATKKGPIELATQAEVDAGADTVRAVTPNTLTNAPQATTTKKGPIELATQAEVDAGADTFRAVTPSTLAGSPHATKVYFGVVNSTGIATKLPSGWSSSKDSSGKYSITHDLGTTSIAVVATPWNSGLDETAIYGAFNTTKFNIYTRQSGALTDTKFSFMLIEY